MSIITLTTDFGTRDWFVGSMKGVILDITPPTTIVDITHEIPSGDIRTGAFALALAYRCFSRNAIHVAVIDPGVGGNRPAIAVKTENNFFVGPDNGVLSFALRREQGIEVRRLDNNEYFRKPVSATFHGRDVFAPVAAHLTQNIPFDSLGEQLADYVRLDWPQPKTVGGVLRGEIVYFDHFGNAITNIELPGQHAGKVRVPGKVECEIGMFYQVVSNGQSLALVGSSGFLEIAVNRGNAASELGLKMGDKVEVI